MPKNEQTHLLRRFLELSQRQSLSRKEESELHLLKIELSTKTSGHAHYLVQQDKALSPFGKTFRTGMNISKKTYNRKDKGWKNEF